MLIGERYIPFETLAGLAFRSNSAYSSWPVSQISGQRFIFDKDSTGLIKYFDPPGDTHHHELALQP